MVSDPVRSARLRLLLSSAASHAHSDRAPRRGPPTPARQACGRRVNEETGLSHADVGVRSSRGCSRPRFLRHAEIVAHALIISEEEANVQKT